MVSKLNKQRNCAHLTIRRNILKQRKNLKISLQKVISLLLHFMRFFFQAMCVRKALNYYYAYLFILKLSNLT